MIMYLKVSFILHLVILAHPELCDFVVIVLQVNKSQRNTQCRSHPAGPVIIGTEKDREQILQPDLSLSEKQQSSGLKPKVIHESEKSNLSSVSLAQIEMK